MSKPAPRPMITVRVLGATLSVPAEVVPAALALSQQARQAAPHVARLAALARQTRKS